MSTTSTMIPIQHRLSVRSAPIRQALHQFGCALRVAIPAIVVANESGNAFNAALQTVSVQPAVQEVIRVNAAPTLTTLPILDDVPFIIPRAGNFALTLPIAVGDECLIVFGDMSADMWWQNGGVQKQPDGKLYRHDIRDGFAIFGVTSNPRALENYSTASAQLRSMDGTVIIDVAEAGVTVTAPLVKIQASGGTPQALVNAAWLTWFQTHIYPFLTGLGYGGPPQPTASSTTILEAQ